MLPNDLVGQPLEVLKQRGYSFGDMDEKQKNDAIWWDDHYKNAHILRMADIAQARYINQGYKKKMMTFITGKMEVWHKDGK